LPADVREPLDELEQIRVQAPDRHRRRQKARAAPSRPAPSSAEIRACLRAIPSARSVQCPRRAGQRPDTLRRRQTPEGSGARV